MRWLLKLWRYFFPRKPDLVLRWHEGDTPPEVLERGELVIARENEELWAAAFICPCGCEERIELALLPDVKPHWQLRSEQPKAPTLHPSVWRKVGCKSHFWVRKGRVHWCGQ